MPADTDAPDIQYLSHYRRLIDNEDEREQYSATNWFRRILSLEVDPPIHAVINSNVIPVFAAFLKHDQNSVRSHVKMCMELSIYDTTLHRVPLSFHSLPRILYITPLPSCTLAYVSTPTHGHTPTLYTHCRTHNIHRNCNLKLRGL